MRARERAYLFVALSCILALAPLIDSVYAEEADPVWQWGSEGNEQCTYTEPKGILGCRWFNYDNGWAHRQVIFNGWEEAHENKALCFHGSFASLMLYYNWPLVSQLSGYTDAQKGAIYHQWDYKAIGNFKSCENDNPWLRYLQNCTSGKCTVADEIGRLTMAVRMASNYPGDSYDQVWLPQNRLRDILRSRLGFINAKVVSVDSNWAIDTISSRLSGRQGYNPQPVVAFSRWHTWLLDNYRALPDKADFHVLTYRNNCNHHTAHWTSEIVNSHDPEAYIYDLDPTIDIQKGVLRSDTLYFGLDHVPNTHGSLREGSFSFQAMGQTETISALIKFGLQKEDEWVVTDTLWKGDFSLGSNGYTTPKFRFDIPLNANVAVILELQAPEAEKATQLRTILNDFEISSQIVIASEEEDHESYNEDWSKQKPLKLMSPSPKLWEFLIGQKMVISWNAKKSDVTDIVASVSVDNGKTWILITPNASIPTEQEEMDWDVPETLDGPAGPVALKDQYLLIRLSGYGNGDAWDITPHAIKMVNELPSSKILRPSMRRLASLTEIDAYSASGRRFLADQKLQIRPNTRRILDLRGLKKMDLPDN